MKLVRFSDPTLGLRVGLCVEGKVYDLTQADETITSAAELIAGPHGFDLTLEDYIANLLNRHRDALKAYEYSTLDSPPSPNRPHLRMPLDPPEVWACGVTYLRSVEARESETAIKGIYDRVYEAARPEVFFKATSSRCVGPHEPVCLRSDAKWNVPEPELAFIVGLDNRIVGYTVGNDMSSRDIEGENPLYLTQAKVYKGCCALGPAIITPASIGDPTNLRIECEILRAKEVVFRGETNTAKMKRKLPELRDYLCRDNPIPPGTVCLTGTSIVPPDDFTLKQGDIVKITIENIGTLTNPVRQL